MFKAFKAIGALIQDDEEIEAKAVGELLAKHREDPDWSGAVQPFVDQLVRVNGIDRQVVCRVLDGMAPNAHAFPHKTIVVAKSLAAFCFPSGKQLAFVVAHELAHIHLGHHRKRSEVNALAGLLSANPLFAIAAGTLLDRGHSRENEFEADRYAVEFCHRAGFAPLEGIEFLERLRRGEQPLDEWRQFLSTHPPLAERIAEARAAALRLQTPPAG